MQSEAREAGLQQRGHNVTMLMRTWPGVAVLLVGLLLAACSKSPLQEKEDAFMAAYKAAKHDIEMLSIDENAYRNWLNRSLSGFDAKSKVRAEKEYQELALKGSAGSQEQLIAARKLIDNPNRLTDMERRASAHGDPSDAFASALEQQANYRQSARRALATWLPPLVKAAEDYNSTYKISYEAWSKDSSKHPIPERSGRTEDALREVARAHASATSTLEIEMRERQDAEKK